MDITKINWTWKRFDEMSGAEMHELLSLRQAVFIIEQTCIYQDSDEWDSQSWHLMGRDLNESLTAYARITFPNSKDTNPTLGRLLVEPKNRGIGLGRETVQHCLEKCALEYPAKPISVSAQTYLITFYEAFGFERVGQPYDDAGVEHIDMLLSQ